MVGMSTYSVRTFGDPVLKQMARYVDQIDGALARLVDDMVDTMYEAEGAGLAAPQVGVQKRLFVYDVGEGPEVMINPTIVEVDGEWYHDEGQHSGWLRPARLMGVAAAGSLLTGAHGDPAMSDSGGKERARKPLSRRT